MTKNNQLPIPPGVSVEGDKLNLTDEFFQYAEDNNLFISLPTKEEEDEYGRKGVELINLLSGTNFDPDEFFPPRP